MVLLEDPGTDKFNEQNQPALMTSLSTASIVFALLSFALAGFGVRILARHGQRILLSIRAKRWPHTHATIEESQIVRVSQTQDRGHFVQVRYLYEVGGISHEGNSIHPCYGRMDYNPSSTLYELKRGNTVRVYHDPNCPSRSTLSVGFHLASLLPVLGGLFAIVPALGFAAWGCIMLAGLSMNIEVLVVEW